jgi:sugar lactone lactonase YvrE
MRLLIILLISFIIIIISCKKKDEGKIRDFILTEKDLVPEGVAFDEASQTIFVSSTYKRKIVSVDKDGRIKDFITEAQDDIKSVIGMDVDEKTNSLWAISCEAEDVLPLKNPGKEQWRSSVYHYSLKDAKLLRKYSLDKDSVFLNDLTVTDDGTVYVTESVQRRVYVLKPGADSLELFLEIKPYHFINGIAFTDKPGLLFVASTEGIVRIDISTKQYSLLPEASSPKALDIDGLTFWNGYFIAHQSKAVTRFYLSQARDSLIRADTLDSGKEFNSSTTGEIANGTYYFIVNSQIQSGIDYTNKKLKPLDSLSDIIIRKIKL